MLNKKIILGLAIAASAALGACSSDAPTDNASATTPTGTSGGLSSQGTNNGSVYGGNGVGSTTASATGDLSQHSVYFDFDSSEIKPESASVVSAWAKYLSAHPTSKARVEGNTDERGTREYNVALGERRANSVASALESQGVSAQQLSIVSYGEEHPVALGHDEESWAQNRRVDLVQQ